MPAPDGIAAGVDDEQISSQEKTMRTALRDKTEEIVNAIRGEFNEMPGMKLTRDQFCRLWQLEGKTAERVLRSLTSSGFLQKDAADRYGRAIDAVR